MTQWFSILVAPVSGDPVMTKVQIPNYHHETDDAKAKSLYGELALASPTVGRDCAVATDLLEPGCPHIIF